jgi:uncharacterized damage-inducible protein DinB
METFITPETETFITTDKIFESWQGHRRLTRKVIEAFPEKELFEYSIGGMRPFAELVREMMGLADGGIRGIKTGDWSLREEMNFYTNSFVPKTKAILLSLWDDITDLLNELWPEIPAKKFQETDAAFGQYENTNYNTLLYMIDNEIHHRGQGYVYLRSLGIEPPAFWDRY